MNCHNLLQLQNITLSSTLCESSEVFVMGCWYRSGPQLDVLPRLGMRHLLYSGGMQPQVARIIMSKSKQDKFSFIKQEVQSSYYQWEIINMYKLISHKLFMSFILNGAMSVFV